MRIRILIVSLSVFFFFQNMCMALTAKHHLFNTCKDVLNIPLSVLKGVFVYAPQNVKKAYNYEVYQREKPEKRKKLRYKIFAIWRAPGEIVKGVIDGVTEGVLSGAKALKEVISIFFSD